MYCHTGVTAALVSIVPEVIDRLGRTLTFSIPKNLSLPSSFTGPSTSCSILSRGVICGAVESFFGGLGPTLGFELPCRVLSAKLSHVAP